MNNFYFILLLFFVDSEVLVKNIQSSWKDLNDLFDEIDKCFIASFKSECNYRKLFTKFYVDEFLSEYLQFIFDNMSKFGETDEDAATTPNNTRQTFLQFITSTFSPPPLFSLCKSVIVKHVSNVNDLSSILPDNVIAHLLQNNV